MASFMDKMNKKAAELKSKASELKDMASEKIEELAETNGQSAEQSGGGGVNYTSCGTDLSEFTSEELTEMAARRARSIAIIETEEVPIWDDLPMIVPESHAKPHKHKKIAGRAVALFLLVSRAAKESEYASEKMVEYADDKDLFSYNEAELMEDDVMSDDDAFQNIWRMEALYVVLWALNLVEALPRPDAQRSFDEIAALMKGKKVKALVEETSLRAQSEVLDAADLIYRYHWAIRNEAAHGREAPDGLERSVVMERHHALNWLIKFDGEDDWDEIRTST